MNWDQQSLNAWLKESAKRDEDAMILQKYAKVDEGKIKVREGDFCLWIRFVCGSYLKRAYDVS